MARIGKQDHARILQLADGEKRKIAHIATEYGCTPANIHALLGRLRRAAAPPRDKRASEPQPVAEPARIEACASEGAPAADLFAVVAEPARPAASPTPLPAPDLPPPRGFTEMPRKGPVLKRGGIGAALARPGYGLTMRTAEGDETLTPFRSLEDLLSAVKPILRAAARSQDAVWFAIGPVDLAQLDQDAA